jgi:phosphate transport system substrate-binding protein
MLGLIRKAAFAVAALGASVVLGEVRLQGAGATFPNPLYQRWVTEYQKSHPDVKIDYQSIGSGGGIKGITEKTVDFAGSDAPLSEKEQTGMGGADNIVQIPSTAGGVVPAYNLKGIDKLNLSGEVLADIYIGKINKWNDPKIVAMNPGVSLPDQAITPASRTDGSGTTFVWTSYLATQSPEFKAAIGVSKTVKFPVGQGGKGNEGVTAVVQQTPGAIGYVELAFADQNKISYAAVKNKSGKFVKASTASISAAGAGAVDKMKGHVLAADIWNQAGDDAYPISSFTYLIVYKDLNNVKSKEQAAALIDFLNWAVTGGQALASELDYAPLADGVRAKAIDALKTITYQGNAVTAAAKQ